jgi:hypothetical protein
MAAALYDSYRDFKGWSDEAAGGDPATYANLLSASGKTGALDVLEMGFGDGSFLDWARGVGHRVAGLEILQSSIAAAVSRGHEAYPSADEIPAGRSFDVILLIDVLEHLDQAGFDGLMALADSRLKPNGVIVARFPNGQSPFFGAYQYGDFTHHKPLSPGAVEQIVRPRGYCVIRAVNPRPMPKRLVPWIRRKAAYLFRDLVEMVLGLAYLGHRTPMDPNVIVTLGRKP